MTALHPRMTIDLRSAPLPGGWRHLSMEAAQGPCCVLEADHPSETLSLTLVAVGLHRIHVGLVVRPHRWNTAMQVRVEPGGSWRRVRPMRLLRNDRYAVQDADLGLFDLPAGGGIQIRTEPECTAALAYVRFEPDVGQCESRRRRNAGVVFDTNMTMSMYRIDEPDDLLAVLRPFVDS